MKFLWSLELGAWSFFRRCSLLAAFALSAAPCARAAEPLRALLICGGCCHDYDAQKTLLTEGVSARANVTWDILEEGGSGSANVVRNHRMSIYEKPDWSKGYDVVVHDECFGDVTNVDFVEHIAKAHYDGVPAVVIHCAIHSYRKSTTDEWRKLLGVSSYYHDGARKFEVKPLQPDHPIMKGFPAVWHDPDQDELYRIVKLWPNCTPLAGTVSTNWHDPGKGYSPAFVEQARSMFDKGQDTTCVWVNTYGKARVFGTTLGHSNTTVKDGAYLDMVTRGLLWACGKLDDHGSPLPGYGKENSSVK